MRVFIRKFEKKMETSVKYLGENSCSLRRCLYLQSVDLAKAVETGDADKYEPVRIR